MWHKIGNTYTHPDNEAIVVRWNGARLEPASRTFIGIVPVQQYLDVVELEATLQSPQWREEIRKFIHDRF